MSKIKIMTDSASDISTADEKQYDIAILPFKVTLGDREYTSRVDFDNEQFYALMAQHNEIPKTAQITPYEFTEIYLREAKNGTTDLVLVLINSKGSATYDNSVKAVEMFYAEHPEYKKTFRVHNFDGIGYNAFYGAPVVNAAKMIKDGAELSAILTYLKDTLPRRQIYFGIYDLKYAGKSGRIPTAVAFVGSVLNIKPVMKIADNAITTAAKCLGEHKLVKTVADLAIAEMEPNTPYEVIYGCDQNCLTQINELMTARVGYAPAGAYQIGAAVAANAGPRVVGVAFTKKAK